MRNGRRGILVLLTAVVATLVLAVAPVAAAGQTQLSGLAEYSTTEVCDDPYPSQAPYTPLLVSGSLEGCLYITNYEIRQSLPNGIYIETGNETFVGCLADTSICGTFTTEYHFESKWAGATEIWGHCEHPIISGTGGFAGVKGILFMTDDVVAGNFNYTGHMMIK